MRTLWVFAVVIGCGGKDDAGTTATGSETGSSGSGVTTTAVKSEPKRSTPPIAGTLRHGITGQQELDVSFDGRTPTLPAISADGTRLARFDIEAKGISQIPTPYAFRIAPVDNKGSVERITLIDEALSLSDNKRIRSHPESTWNPPAPVLAKLRDTASTIETKLRKGGFVSLDGVETRADAHWGLLPAKIGGLTLTAHETDDRNGLEVELVDAGGRSLDKETMVGYQTKESPPSLGGDFCHYSPHFDKAFTDAAKRTLYVLVGFHFNEGCELPPVTILAWRLP